MSDNIDRSVIRSNDRIVICDSILIKYPVKNPIDDFKTVTEYINYLAINAKNQFNNEDDEYNDNEERA